MSAQLHFEVNHQIITRTDKSKPVADSKNYLYAHFDFLTEDWTGIITIIFTKNDTSYQVILNQDNECLVPWELLVGSGDIYVSCFCGNLVTANKSRVHIAPSGYVSTAQNVEPASPSIYSQITAYVDDLREDLLTIDGGIFGDERDE